jgi:hypothetical protein
MGKRPRNSDGTVRSANQAKRLTNRSIIARWVETETLHLKRLGMATRRLPIISYGSRRCSRRRWRRFPQGLAFPRITRSRCRRFTGPFDARSFACPTRMPSSFAPSTPSAVKTCSSPCRQVFAKATRAASRWGVKVLAHKAEINGYKMPGKVELTGKQGGPLAIETFRRMCEEAEREQAEAEESTDDATTK